METTNMNGTQPKQKIYNLVILDKSGSMSSIANAAISGFNETIGGIRSAQEQFKDTQEHFVSLMVFCNCDKSFVYDNVPVAQVKELTSRDYRPCCGTPLYDAMGISLNKLLKDIQDDPTSTAVVTVITDGYENASREYSLADIKALVDRLKEQEGWNFSYIGTNQDVEKTSHDLSIDNHMVFIDDEAGMAQAWLKERNSKARMYRAMSSIQATITLDEQVSFKARMANLNKTRSNYVADDSVANRTTRKQISTLEPDEIVVFGSNIQGAHHGGFAKTCVKNFGAIMGQAEGLQGQSYAIPTVGTTKDEIQAAVSRFVNFAQQHPDKKFLVTRIGCGSAGYTPRQIAPMFAEAYEVPNIFLPADFWKYAL